MGKRCRLVEVIVLENGARICYAMAMTFASKITVSRLLLVPVFAVLAIYYSRSVQEHHANENLRFAALIVFVVASASDALDGFIARRFNQRSKFGAFIDPIADKTLLLTGIITLSMIDWGSQGWRIPLWFAALVIVRDCIILGGILVLWLTVGKVKIQPHWSGKGWVMLRMVPFPPVYVCALAAFFTVWSGVAYFRQGLHLLQHTNVHHPDSHP